MAGDAVKRVLYIVLVLAVVSTLSAWKGWRSYEHFADTPLSLPGEGLVIVIEPGSTGMNVVNDLAARGVTSPGWRWKLLMRLEPSVFRTGEYALPGNTTPRSLLRLLSSGKVIQYRFTIVEGWSFRQLAERMAADPVLERELDLSDPYAWHPGTHFEDMKHAEGWFLPETYVFTRGDTDFDVLRRAHIAMKKALDEAWAERDTGLPLDTPYEMLILASIIEKETARDDERDRIAGVFARRLVKGMRLQTDPTVIYGMGESFDGDIRRKDLRTDTPYNTYTRHGLPPTPIAMPGVASLRAAANPAPGDELYFVADGEGGHTFSRTLEEHRAAVNELIGRN